MYILGVDLSKPGIDILVAKILHRIPRATLQTLTWEFPKIRGTLLGVPTILGSLMGSTCFAYNISLHLGCSFGSLNIFLCFVRRGASSLR